jgi:hypothetical protein
MLSRAGRGQLGAQCIETAAKRRNKVLRLGRPRANATAAGTPATTALVQNGSCDDGGSDSDTADDLDAPPELRLGHSVSPGWGEGVVQVAAHGASSQDAIHRCFAVQNAQRFSRTHTTDDTTLRRHTLKTLRRVCAYHSGDSMEAH